MSAFALAGICLGALALLLAAFGWLAAERLTRRRKPDPPDSPEAHGLPFEAVRFLTRDGLALGGWYVTRGEPRPAVVLCPGHNGSMDADLKHAPWLWQAGFDVLLFDWRAHGASEGKRVSMGVRERLDLLAALDFLKARGVTRVGLMGFSMGGAVVLRVAAEDETGLVKAVVSDGGFARIRRAIEGYLVEDAGLPGWLARVLGGYALWAAGLRAGVRLSQADTLPYVSRVAPRPILFIHGGRDPYVPRADQDALFAAAGQPKQMWRVDEGGHRDADTLHRDEYRRRVLAFLREYLAP